MLYITSVTYLQDYMLRISFSDGFTHDVNLADELYGEIFEPLKNKAYFSEVFVDKETRTIAWPNGADMAPEFLYALEKS